MRVCGVKETGFAVSVRTDSPRIFLRVGLQRYAATAEEAIELADFLADAVDALRSGTSFTQQSRHHMRDDGS